MLLLPEEQLPACCKPIGAEAAGTSLGAEIGDVIAAVLMSRFSSRTVAEICARVASPSTPSAAASPTARSLGWALRRASKKAARPKPPANFQCRCGNLGSGPADPAHFDRPNRQGGMEQSTPRRLALPRQPGPIAVVLNKTTKNPSWEHPECVEIKTAAHAEKSHKNLNPSGCRSQNKSQANESRMSLMSSPELLAER